MKIIGTFLILLGAIGVALVLNMDTSVLAEGLGRRVNNLGLMQQQQNLLIVCVTAAVVGAVFLGLSLRQMSSPHSTRADLPIANAKEKKCLFCAESIKLEAILCRYCGRESPQSNIHRLDGLDQELAFHLRPENVISMQEYGIAFVGNRYQVQGQEFTRLGAAIAHAKHLHAEQG